MRKLICFLFVLSTSAPVTSFAATGVIKSSNEREPQVIVLEENPKDSNLIIYKLCHTNERKTCVTLGNVNGINKNLLAEKSRQVKKIEAFTKYFQPISAIAVILATVYLTVQTGGVTVAFFAGSGSYLLIDWVYSDKHNPNLLHEISTLLDPQSKGYFVLTTETSILDFSYALEETLNSLEKEGFNGYADYTIMP